MRRSHNHSGTEMKVSKTFQNVHNAIYLVEQTVSSVVMGAGAVGIAITLKNLET